MINLFTKMGQNCLYFTFIWRKKINTHTMKIVLITSPKRNGLLKWFEDYMTCIGLRTSLSTTKTILSLLTIVLVPTNFLKNWTPWIWIYSKGLRKFGKNNWPLQNYKFQIHFSYYLYEIHPGLYLVGEMK